MKLPSTLKALVKRRLKVLRLHIGEALFAFDAQRLRTCLAGLGVGAGDTVLVHSSYDAFQGFQGKPNDVVQVLQGCVGTTGLLMMPTMSFTGSAIELARSGAVFDVRRTPSRMGMISELFRRSPGVVRSVHPTHPVACWGAEAASVAQGHHLSDTPCGKGTPFEALLHRRGKILLLGTDISVLTFYHHLEEVFEAALPASPFTQEVFVLHSKTAEGELVETRCRLYDTAMSRRRNLHKLVPYLKKHAAWREGRVRRLRMVLLQAAGVEAAMREMNQQGVYCYD